MNAFLYTIRGIIRLALYFPVRVNITGREHFPGTGGFILAGNHVSYSDPPIMGSCCPREVHFMAKAELFRNPAFGWLLRICNSHALTRGKGDMGALRVALDILKANQGLVIFPEGTRSRTGELGKPKAGIGMVARKAGCPIIPCFGKGQENLLDCIFGRQKMRIMYGEPIPLEWIAAQPPGKAGAIAIAEEVMNRIRQLKESAEAS